MEDNQPHWAGAILSSLAWLICSLFVIVDVLLIRETSLDVMTAIQLQRVESAARGKAGIERLETGFAVEAIDQTVMLIGGIVAVGFAVGLEYYFRRGRQQGRLLQRIAMVVGILIAVAIVCLIIQMLV